MLGLAEAGQVRVEGRDDRTLMAEVDLDLAQVLALLQQMRGIGVAQGMDVRRLFDAAGFEGEAEDALQRGPTHGLGGRPGTPAAVAFGGKEPLRMTMGFPLLAQPQQRALGQRDITILIALAGADMQEHPFGVDVADLETQTFTQAQAARVDGDQANAMIQGGHRRQETAHFARREHDRKFELGIGPGQLQFVGPNPLERFFPEDFEGANGLGARRAGDLLVGLEMNAILTDLLGGNQLGRFGVELTELADAGVVRRLGARADGQELQIIGVGF